MSAAPLPASVAPRAVLLLRCALVCALPAGCWKEGLAELPPLAASFAPAGVDLGAPWSIAALQVPGLACPDGELHRFYVVYPPSATGGAPMPAAAIYPDGAFDFVFAPVPSDPLSGAHFAEPSRLDAVWANHQVYATLGAYPDPTGAGADAGTLPAALAEQGVAMVIPENCWGDLWHNEPGIANNDVDQDFFVRNGRSAADWAYRLLADPTFAPFFGLELPITVDPAATFVLGLGSGGRAVGEVLAIVDREGAPVFSPSGALVDSSYDSFDFAYDDPTAAGPLAAGLDRIFVGGREEAAAASLHGSSRLPERMAVVFSDADPAVPQSTFAPLAAAIPASPSGWLYIDDQPVHGVLNRADRLDLARSAVSYLLTGVQPPAGPGVLPIAD